MTINFLKIFQESVLKVIFIHEGRIMSKSHNFLNLLLKYPPFENMLIETKEKYEDTIYEYNKVTMLLVMIPYMSTITCQSFQTQTQQVCTSKLLICNSKGPHGLAVQIAALLKWQAQIIDQAKIIMCVVHELWHVISMSGYELSQENIINATICLEAFK